MIIKSAVLDIVCGITSKIPDTGLPELWHLQVNQMLANRL